MIKGIAITALGVIVGLTPMLAIAHPIRPNARLTPGEAVADDTVAEACSRGYAQSHWNVRPQERAAVLIAYGIDSALAVFELTGCRWSWVARTPENWSQAYRLQPWGAYLKDQIEDCVRKHGAMSLRDGQALFLGDWIAAYQ